MRFLVILPACLRLAAPATAWEATQNYPAKSVRLGRSLIAKAPTPEVLFIPFPDEEAVALGEGIDLISGGRKPIHCVTNAPIETVVFNNKDAFFSEVTDDESLWERLNMSISAKASYLGYSGGGSYSSSVETKTSSSKISIVAQAALKTYAKMLSSTPASTGKLDLTSYAQNIKSPADFRRICGDGYISQITYGADLYGIYDFHGLSYQQKKKMTAAVDAAGPADIFKANANMTFESEYNHVEKQTRIQSIERGAGVDFNFEFASDRSGLIRNFQTLPARARDHERPIFLTVRRYSTLPSSDKQYMEVVGNIEAMIRQAMRLKTLINDYNIEMNERGGASPANPAFVVIPLIEMKEREASNRTRYYRGLLERLEKLNKKISACMDNTTSNECKVVDAYDDLSERAAAPLPSNAFDSIDLAGLREMATIEPARRSVACQVARVAALQLIRRVETVRCERNNECSSDTDLAKAIDKTYGTYGVATDTCGIPNGVSEALVVEPAGNAAMTTFGEIQSKEMELAPARATIKASLAAELNKGKVTDLSKRLDAEAEFWATATDRNLSREQRGAILNPQVNPKPEAAK